MRENRWIWASLAILFAVVSLSAKEPASKDVSGRDWPQWRGPNRDNHSAYKSINADWAAQKPSLLWKVEGVGKGYASVSVVGDRVYTTGNLGDGEKQHVICVDMKAKKVLWKQQISEKKPEHGYDGSRCTPSIVGDKLYAISSDGNIVCLNAETGKPIWGKSFITEWQGKMMSGWGFSESPLVDGDHVLCTPGSDQAMIVCLNRQNGKEIWRSAVPDQGEKGSPGAGYASMVIGHGAGVKQYVQLIGRGLIGVRASDGKLLWRYNHIANNVADIPTAIVKDDYVFGSTGYGDGGSGLVKLSKDGDGVKAEEVYYLAANQLQNHHGGMVLVGDYLYFGNGHNNGFPVCVEFLTGKIKWGGKLRGVGKESACITYVDGHIIYRYQQPGEDGDSIALVEATPDEYRLKGSFRPEVIEREGWAHPVVANGKLFLREQNSLMCYDIAKAK